MSNEVEREFQLYEQYESDQRSQEAQKLREFTNQQTLATWAAMTRKMQVLAYRAVNDEGKEVWSSDVVKAVYSTCTQEIQRLRAAKSEEAFDLDLTCDNCVGKKSKCAPHRSPRTNRVTCSPCATAKTRCSRPAQYMWHKFAKTWERMGLGITDDNFLDWYPEVMKQQSPYVVKKGDATGTPNPKKKRGSAKGKEKAVDSGGDEEDGEEEDAGKKGKGVGRASAKVQDDDDSNDSGEDSGGERMGGGEAGSKKQGPPKVGVPGPSRVPVTTPKGSENAVAALKAKIKKLEAELRVEVERTDNLVEGKAHYKKKAIEAKEDLKQAEGEIKELETALEKSNSEKEVMKEKVQKLHVKFGELEKLTTAMEEYQKERGEYEEWKKSGRRRAELVEELKKVEEDRARLRVRVLELEREKREIEDRRETEARRFESVGKEVEAERKALEVRVRELEVRVREMEELLREFTGESSEEEDGMGNMFSVAQDGAAALPVLRALLVQNGELRDDLQAFQAANFRVNFLLGEAIRLEEAVKLQGTAEGFGKAGLLLAAAKTQSTVVGSRSLVFPDLVESSSEVANLEGSVGRWQAGGMKRSAEGSGEGSEDRRKRARRMLGSED